MSTSDTQVLPPPTQPRQPLPPLRRSTSDRMIGGVCGGIGRRYGIDPVVLRVVFVVGILVSGVGLLVYLALWLLLPTDQDTSSNALTRSVVPLVVGVLLGVGAVAALLGWFGQLGGLAGVVVGAFLVGMAVWLYQRRDRWPVAPPAVTDPSTAYSAPSDAGLGTAPPTGFAYGGTGYAPGTGPVLTPPPARERSYLGLITVCAALVVGAGLAAAAAAGISPIGIVGGFAAVLGVLAIGMLIGAFRGRAKWLAVVALPLALMLGLVGQVVSILPGSIDPSMGAYVWTPKSPSTERLGVGEATLDLRPWAGSGSDQPRKGDIVTAEVGFGELRVVVPDTWQVQVDATASTGDITVNGESVRSQSPAARYSGTLAPTAGGDAVGQVTLVLRVTVGEIDIRQRPVMTGTVGGQPLITPTPTPTPAEPPNPARDQGKNPQNPQQKTKENSR